MKIKNTMGMLFGSVCIYVAMASCVAGAAAGCVGARSAAALPGGPISPPPPEPLPPRSGGCEGAVRTSSCVVSVESDA